MPAGWTFYHAVGYSRANETMTHRGLRGDLSKRLEQQSECPIHSVSVLRDDHAVGWTEFSFLLGAGDGTLSGESQLW